MWLPEFKAMLSKARADISKRKAERIRKSGKHTCVARVAGTVSRLTGRGDRILKRPVIVSRFYECKICGKDMQEVKC